MLSKELQRKIDINQYTILTNYNLHKYGYIKVGIKDTKQQWAKSEFWSLKHHNWQTNNPDKIKAIQRKNYERHKNERHKYYLKHKQMFVLNNQHFKSRHPDEFRKIQHVASNKCNIKRRCFGFIPLNDYFDDCVAHHINKDLIIYIPQDIHRSFYHSVLQNRNMVEINSLAFTWLNLQVVM